MARRTTSQKGYDFEELLRAYFLRAGFYVLRGVPVRFEGEDATDVDLWLYERPTGTARRRQITDAKFKQKPKAAERLFWTKGLSEMLDVDGAYVATTDKRRSLRPIAKKLGVTLIDGADLDRMKQSDRVLYPDRMNEEELTAVFKSTDLARKTKDLQDTYLDLKGSVATSFSAPLINIALEGFAMSARESVTSHQNSDAAKAYGRLAYFSASVAAASLDFVSVEEPFKSADERRQIFVNAVRFGFTSKDTGTEKLRLAAALIRQYANKGSAVASMVEKGVLEDFEKVPAEIIAEQSVKMSSNGQLFQSARAFEHWAFSHRLPTFDDLETRDKALLGALLDFSDVGREDFASAWVSEVSGKKAVSFAEMQATFQSDTSNESDLGPLFRPTEGES